jgi:hypothetical protein
MVLGLHPALLTHIKTTWKNKMIERIVYNCDSCLNDIKGDPVTIRSSANVGVNRLELGLNEKHFCDKCSEGVEVLIKETYQKIFNKLQGGSDS